MKYYVDKKRHLVCYPYSIKNLHAMAKVLEINKCWFHKNHYDVPKRDIERINCLAEIVSPKEIVRIIKGMSPASAFVVS